MWSFHTPTQKITPTSKNSPTKFQIFTKILKPSISPYFSTKIALHQKFTPYRTQYRQTPCFTTLFRPLSHKIQLKIFTNSLSHPNFLLYTKLFLRCTIFTSKNHHQLFPKSKIFKPSQRIILVYKINYTRRHCYDNRKINNN